MDLKTFLIGFIALMGIFDMMHCIVHCIKDCGCKVDTSKYPFKKF